MLLVRFCFMLVDCMRMYEGITVVLVVVVLLLLFFFFFFMYISSPPFLQVRVCNFRIKRKSRRVHSRHREGATARALASGCRVQSGRARDSRPPRKRRAVTRWPNPSGQLVAFRPLRLACARQSGQSRGGA